MKNDTFVKNKDKQRLFTFNHGCFNLVSYTFNRGKAAVVGPVTIKDKPNFCIIYGLVLPNC